MKGLNFLAFTVLAVMGSHVFAMEQGLTALTDTELSAELLEARHIILLEEIKELEAEVKQIAKELKETGSINPKTKANLMKEMADVQYVLSGTAITFNLPMEEVFNRVHESNMSR